MTDDPGEAAFDDAVDTALREAEIIFAAAEADGAWTNWRMVASNDVPPWWDAGAEWVWALLAAKCCWEDLTPSTYRRVMGEAMQMLAIDLFNRVLRRYQDRAFGPYAPDMKEQFANHVHVRLLPRVAARMLEPVAAKHVEPTKMPKGSARVATSTKRHPRTIGTMAAAERMEAHLEDNGISMTDFASTVGTSDRTLRKFRQTGRISRGIFDAIAREMGLTRDGLLSSGR